MNRQKRKEPPGNRAALSSGRIVPTEAKPSELSGCIVGAGGESVKEKCSTKYVFLFHILIERLLLETRRNTSTYVRLCLPDISRLLGVFLRVYAQFPTGETRH